MKQTVTPLHRTEEDLNRLMSGDVLIAIVCNSADHGAQHPDVRLVVPTLADANAEFIVRACNTHEALVQALVAILDEAKSWHSVHHGQELVSCDSICRLIATMERALAMADGKAQHDQEMIYRFQNDPLFHRMVDTVRNTIKNFSAVTTDWKQAIEFAEYVERHERDIANG